MNPLRIVLTTMHEHMTADNDEIYVETLRLVQHIMDETDVREYETDSDGEAIIQNLQEVIADYDAGQRDVDDNEEDDEDILDRDNEDLDDDDKDATVLPVQETTQT